MNLRDINDKLPADLLEKIDIVRQQEVEYIRDIMFTLSYHTSLTKKDLEDMSMYELETWQDTIIKYKKAEHEVTNQ